MAELSICQSKLSQRVIRGVTVHYNTAVLNRDAEQEFQVVVTRIFRRCVAGEFEVMSVSHKPPIEPD